MPDRVTLLKNLLNDFTGACEANSVGVIAGLLPDDMLNTSIRISIPDSSRATVLEFLLRVLLAAENGSLIGDLQKLDAAASRSCLDILVAWARRRQRLDIGVDVDGNYVIQGQY